MIKFIFFYLFALVLSINTANAAGKKQKENELPKPSRGASLKEQIREFQERKKVKAEKVKEDQEIPDNMKKQVEEFLKKRRDGKDSEKIERERSVDKKALELYGKDIRAANGDDGTIKFSEFITIIKQSIPSITNDKIESLFNRYPIASDPVRVKQNFQALIKSIIVQIGPEKCFKLLNEYPNPELIINIDNLKFQEIVQILNSRIKTSSKISGYLIEKEISFYSEADPEILKTNIDLILNYENENLDPNFIYLLIYSDPIIFARLAPESLEMLLEEVYNEATYDNKDFAKILFERLSNENEKYDRADEPIESDITVETVESLNPVTEVISIKKTTKPRIRKSRGMKQKLDDGKVQEHGSETVNRVGAHDLTLEIDIEIDFSIGKKPHKDFNSPNNNSCKKLFRSKK